MGGGGVSLPRVQGKGGGGGLRLTEMAQCVKIAHARKTSKNPHFAIGFIHSLIFRDSCSVSLCVDDRRVLIQVIDAQFCLICNMTPRLLLFASVS